MVVSTVLIVVVTAMTTTIATTILNGSIMSFPMGFHSRTSHALGLLRRYAARTNRRLGYGRLRRAPSGLEQDREQNEYQRCSSGWHQPDRMPVVRDLQALTGSRRFGTAGGIGSCVPIDDR